MAIFIEVEMVGVVTNLVQQDLFPDEAEDYTLNPSVKDTVEALLNHFTLAEQLPEECTALSDYSHICNLVTEAIIHILNIYPLRFIRHIELCDRGGTLIIYH